VDHSEIRRIVSGADTAVVFIHGILGSPRQFDDFWDLVPLDYSAVNLLLPGHGGSVRDFADSSMKAWRDCVRNTLMELRRTHSRIIICAHSMGCLLSIDEAVRDPDNIAGLFLLAAPLRICPTLRMVKNALNIYRNKTPKEDAFGFAAKKACSVRQDKILWHYLLWIPRYLELFAASRRSRSLISDLAVPTIGYFSLRDEMVSAKSANVLKNSPEAVVRLLQHSGHFYYDPEDLLSLQQAFKRFLEK